MKHVFGTARFPVNKTDKYGVAERTGTFMSHKFAVSTHASLTVKRVFIRPTSMHCGAVVLIFFHESVSFISSAPTVHSCRESMCSFHYFNKEEISNMAVGRSESLPLDYIRGIE